MKTYLLHIALAFLVFTGISCKETQKSIRPKPEWINNRPVNEAYYVGIGIASKVNSPNDYQQIAKRNALNDLISEIKVTVSTNSVLSQYQNNLDFKQQFESDTRITALNTIENFETVDSWENKETYWVYYRLSKLEYEAARRRKMMTAVERSEDFFKRADQFDMRKNYIQSLRLKIKAIVAVQDYLSEDLQTSYNGRNVYLVNELLSSIQDQLYAVTLVSNTTVLKGKVGKPIYDPFDVSAYMSDTSSFKQPVPYLPLRMNVEQGKMDFGAGTETDHNGVASFTVARIASRNPIQLIRIMTDMERIIKVDSTSQSLKNILMALDVPSTTIRVNVEGIKLYMDANEQNMSKALAMGFMEPALKKQFVEAGCNFVPNEKDADYIVKLRCTTQPLGIIWGNMQSAALDMNIVLIDNKNNTEIYKDALLSVRGFQTTPENAGIDAYKTATGMLIKGIYPKLQDELMKQ